MAILPSHKNGIHYFEHARVVASDTRLTIIKQDDAIEKHYSIPHKNLLVLLMGPGTSITQSAARMMAGEGVTFGFTGGGGTPLFLTSESEYRPTEYLQGWIRWWAEEERRLLVAKDFQQIRINNVRNLWPKYLGGDLAHALSLACNQYESQAQSATRTDGLLGYEGSFSKSLYRLIHDYYKAPAVSRDPLGKDPFNQNLTAGNYMAYGFAAAALWVLGIPHSLAVVHGKTRRGALVFDVADLVKDAIVMPTAFQASQEQMNSAQFRSLLIDRFDKARVVPQMIESLQHAALQA